MPKIRVLIVDDSVVMRRLLSDAISADPDIEVIGTAANGLIGLAKIAQLKPDLVTLDVEMPELDGLQTLQRLRPDYPKLPVIMFSTLTERGAATTLEALAAGATDYVTKPANLGSVGASIQAVREELVPRIKAACARTVANLARPVRAPLPPQAPRKQPSARVFDVVAIGVSTGGPNALAAIFANFPADFPVPIVVVQHMPPVFTKSLANRLGALGRLRVTEAITGDVLAPGHALIAPGNFHMEIARAGVQTRVNLHQGPPENSCRPAVDVLFRSVAAVYGGASLAVVLTGMGQDGLRGCETIAAAHGTIMVQDEASSVVWGMPGAVANAGLADVVLPLDQIAVRITQLVTQGARRDAATPASANRPTGTFSR